jgi:hypothetical protein
MLGLTGRFIDPARRRGHIGRGLKAAHEAGCRLHGGTRRLRSFRPMAMDAREIESLITAALPDAKVEIRDLLATATTTRRPSPRRPSRARAGCSSTRWSIPRCRAAWATSCTPLR